MRKGIPAPQVQPRAEMGTYLSCLYDPGRVKVQKREKSTAEDRGLGWQPSLLCFGQ